MTLDDIALILDRLEPTEVIECEIEHASTSVRIRFDRTCASHPKPPAEAAFSDVAPVRPDPVVVRAPSTGVLRLTHPLSSDGFRNPGEVRRGQHLGYLEIDSILTAIVSPADGAALTLCSTEGALVSFGQAVAEVHDIRPT